MARFEEIISLRVNKKDGTMPRNVVELSEHPTRVVNAVMARDGLAGKSEAIERIIEEYEEKILDPPLRPEFVANLQRIQKGKFRRASALDDIVG